MIDCDPILRARKSTVLFHPGWHKGVIGIVASRLIEKYYRPTIVLTRSGNTITGSARSVRGFDLHNAISACRSEEHTSELQSLMRISYAVFCLKKKKK